MPWWRRLAIVPASLEDCLLPKALGPSYRRGRSGVDVSAVCDYSGTRVLYNNAYHYCDYNTWGTDFYINPDGSGQCNDRC